jgi:hypothetical protein
VKVGTSDLGASVKVWFGVAKAGVVLEYVDSPQIIWHEIAIAQKGRDIIVAGASGDKPVVDMGTVQDRDLRLIGTLI